MKSIAFFFVFAIGHALDSLVDRLASLAASLSGWEQAVEIRPLDSTPEEYEELAYNLLSAAAYEFHNAIQAATKELDSLRGSSDSWERRGELQDLIADYDYMHEEILAMAEEDSCGL